MDVGDSSRSRSLDGGVSHRGEDKTFPSTISANGGPGHGQNYASNYQHVPSQASGTFSAEAYGEVPSSVSNRRRSGERHPAGGSFAHVPPASHDPFAGTRSAYAAPKQQPVENQATLGLEPKRAFFYSHNRYSFPLLALATGSVIWWHESALVLQIFLYASLILYGLDLVNARDGLVIAVWMSALLLTMASAFCTLLEVDDSDASGGAMLIFLVRLSVEAMLFCSLACWLTLQLRWLHKEAPAMATGLEGSLHALIPPVASSVLSHHAVRVLSVSWNSDAVATITPYIFCVFMAAGMCMVGGAPSSFSRADASHHLSFAVSRGGARTHIALLLMVPGLMHVMIFRSRIFSRTSSWQDLYDLVLVWAFPYLLLYVLRFSLAKFPYKLPKAVFPEPEESTLRGAAIPLSVSLGAFAAVQFRYLLPLCRAVSYQFNGHNLPSDLVVSTYLALATACLSFALWIWGRTSVATNELLFGDYHDDVVQLTISTSGFLLGKAFGIPWNYTPFPILAFLGLSVWVTTRMLRYLCIFLFVIHTGGAVLFSYRFASIDISLPLAVPGLEVSLVRMGMLEVLSSGLIGLVVGFALRPSGGVGSRFLKLADVPGFLLVFYSAILTVLELSLTQGHAPQELVGREPLIASGESTTGYGNPAILLTTCLLGGLAFFFERCKVITKTAATTTFAIAAGKAVAAYVSDPESAGTYIIGPKRSSPAGALFFRAFVAALLFAVMLLPSATLTPIHVKGKSRYKRSLSDGKHLAAMPPRVHLTISVYSLLILPVVIFASIKFVLQPLIMSISAHYGEGAYYAIRPPLSESIGLAAILWSVSTLTMLNHFLPDGGGETWKKSAALLLLMGATVVFFAPAVPEWRNGDQPIGISSPFAYISSAGTELLRKDRNRTGGWGILSASLASLLAVAGPLELREQRHQSGRKDQFLLMRLMIFSILFGGGLSWFVTIQSLSQANFITLVVTAASCMILSFFGTVTCVLATFLDLENFDEVYQMAQISGAAFLLLIAVTAGLTFVSGADQETGPWLSTYLVVSSLLSFALSCSLRARSRRNRSSRGLGNISCVSSYILATAVLYGNYGVAGLGQFFAVTTLAGLPFSVVGTVALSSLLVLLEGEVANERRTRVSRIVATGAKTAGKAPGLNIEKLQTSNRVVPVFFAVVVTFLLASMYTIFLRGSRTPQGVMPGSQGTVSTKDGLAVLVRESVAHSEALITSARLSACSVWTAESPLGPMIHIIGLLLVLPSFFSLLNAMWNHQQISTINLLAVLPLNFIPLFLCRGTPSLQTAALICLLGGGYQLLQSRQSSRRTAMRI